MAVHYFHSEAPFVLESGAVLPRLTIAYTTLGTRRPDNVVWVCHALTANSDVADWWSESVGAGTFLDPEKSFIVCANILGSHYGTTGPLSENPATGQPYYGTFPSITVRDMVAAHRLLAAALKIDRVELLIGSSLGGFQCMEWAISDPLFARRLVLIATSVQSYPWAVALNESQRMAIESDPTFGLPADNAGMAGLRTARSIALLSYRGQMAYDKTQHDPAHTEKLTDYRAASYQRYQGEKLCRRYNAYSYYTITRAVDSHNIARGRTSVESALGRIAARTMIISISSDLLFPVAYHHIMQQHIPGACHTTIDSDFGHDGFLVEHDKLNDIIINFLKNE